MEKRKLSFNFHVSMKVGTSEKSLDFRQTGIPLKEEQTLDVESLESMCSPLVSLLLPADLFLFLPFSVSS